MFLIGDEYWFVKETSVMGSGVFARKEIAKGTVIGDYIGIVIKTEEYDIESDKRGLYLMYMTDEASVYPDLAKPGIHLLNHSCNPNCWIYVYQGHTLFFAIRDIKAGEQLCISYLLDPKDKYCEPCLHDCVCGAANCTGTMHLTKEKFVLWQNFQDSKKSGGSPNFSYGTSLPLLSSYPQTLPVDSIYKRLIEAV
jgi:uncharacterized protein